MGARPPLPDPTDRASLRRVLLCAAVAAFAGGCDDRTPSAPSSVVQPSAALSASGTRAVADFVAGRVIVALAPGAAAGDVAGEHGLGLQREIGPSVWLASVAPGSEVAVADALSRNPNVRFAEPDWLRSFEDPLCPGCARPDDNFLEWQWNMHNDGYVDLGYGTGSQTGAVDADIDWLEAYDVLGPDPAGSVMIGILDTGVRATHIDICGKVALQKNFYDGSAFAIDDHGHGSHVAAIAAACAGNTGVVGVAYGSGMQLMIGKVCAADGSCAVSGIVEGLYWMADNGADVLNMSFGDPAQSQAEADALQYVVDAGVLPVCAAGNEGSSQIIFPAADPNCVAVTATNWGDGPASYSNRGPQAELAAPGGDLGDIFGLSYIISAWNGYDDDYVLTIGTSMATPHVTGLAGLVHALGLSGAQAIRECLQATADDLGSPGRDDVYGYGRINMLAAVQAVQAGDCMAPPDGGGNTAPIASFTVDCTDLTCDFDATASTDPDGTIVGWSWDFGDGATGSGETTSHTYASAGDLTVVLTVTDDAGGTDDATGVADPRDPPAEPGPSVEVVDMFGWSEAGKGNRWRAFLTVTIGEVGGGPVAGASVSVSWAGAAGGSASGSTGTDGSVDFATEMIRGGNAVIFTVTGVTPPSGTWDDGGDPPDLVVYAPGAGNEAPAASFTWSCDDLACAFTDASSDGDGSVVAWAWDFGGDGTSAEQSPGHVFSGAGTWAVSLTVTDDVGATDTFAASVTVPAVPSPITLEATGRKERGVRYADLAWSGIVGTADVYRDGVLIASGVASPWTDDTLGNGGGEAVYKVCEAGGTDACSNPVTVTF